MYIPAKLKVFCIYLMTAILSHLPNLALAKTAENLVMIPTSAVILELTREQASAKVGAFLKLEDVRKQLIANGISPEEASGRLASLSEYEMRELAGQMQQARAGGDVLYTILIVLLIIFLIKRI